MKVIGIDGSGNYIAIVTHTEVEKCANKHYNRLDKLKVGSEFDIGAGYNFANQIESACKSMLDAQMTFDKAQSTLTAFANMVVKNSSNKEEVRND